MYRWKSGDSASTVGLMQLMQIPRGNSASRTFHEALDKMVDGGSDRTAMDEFIGQDARHEDERTFVRNVRQRCLTSPIGHR